MDENNLEAALISLENLQDGSKLLKILVTIRQEVDWPSKRDNIHSIREKNCLKQFVAVLQSNQKNIIDVALSILGNCCMDSAFTKDIIGQYNILQILYHLLKRYAKENSINGRIFRIIGNMCQHRGNWANTVITRKPQIITYIVEFLKTNAKCENQSDKVTEGTIVMAIRSLRELLNKYTFKPLIKTYGVLESIGMLLIKYSLEWEKSKKYEGILHGIIKLLQGYSSFKYYRSILEMKNTESGDAIIHLSKILLLAPKQIVRIIMNFIEISQLKSDLPIPEIFDGFIGVLRNILTVQEFNDECEGYVQSLCYLLEHPANRQSERCSKSIPLLIEVLSNLKLPNRNIIKCCTLIIGTLCNCRYDNALMLEQLKCNIIDILIDKFKWIVGCTETLNTDHKDDKKRKFDIMNKRFNSRCDEIKFCETTLSNDKFDYFFNNYIRHSTKCDRSPSSESRPVNCFERSPSCSSDFDSLSWASIPSPSSSSLTSYLSESDSDDDYSPVCSEADAMEFVSPQCFEDELLTHNEAEKSQDVQEIETSERSGVFKLKVELFMEMMKLLKLYVKLKPPVLQLIKSELLIALIKCSGHFNCSSSSTFFDTIQFICMMLSSHDYLLPLMQTNFIPMVYSLTEMQHGIWCVKCNYIQQIGCSIILTISKLAESGAGKGDIAHHLIRGDDIMKEQLVLAIPYIIRNKSILSKLMLNCGGLDVLMRLLRIESDLKENCIKVLCVMAVKKLAISNPSKKTLELYQSQIFPDEQKIVDTNSAHVVTFKLDDGSELIANRVLLSKKSDFFNKLLNGHFKESNEDEIKLQNVINKSLYWLLYFLQCNINKTVNKESDLELETLLDVIALCDRFLLVNLSVSLTHYVEQHRISAKTVPIIYQWSLESNTNLLRVESVAYALVANMVDSERFDMFQNLFNLGYSDELVDDIQSLLFRYLSLRSNHQ